MERSAALVLEGGGFRGIFTAGALDVMQEHGIYGFGSVWGVSAGAINAASYKSKQIGRGMRIILAFRDDRRFMSLWSWATTGNIAGADVPTDIDSKNLSKAFLGKSKKGRDNLILEAKSHLALKEGPWILIPPYNGRKVRPDTGTELGNLSEYALFNLAEDPHQDRDLASAEPEKLEAMKTSFHSLVGDYYDPDITAKLKKRNE